MAEYAERAAKLGDGGGVSDAEELAVRRKFDELMDLARSDGPGFIQQVLLLDSRSDWGEVSPAMVFLREDARLSPGDYAVALAPLLYCDDDGIRKRAREWFPKVLGRGSPYGHPDMSHLEVYVKGNYQEPEIATSLQRALFEVDPNGAFLFFHTSARPTEYISLRRLERTIANAIYEKRYLGGLQNGKIDAETAQAVRELAGSSYWWARLFIAELMVQHREFRQADLVIALQKDESALVRQSVASIDHPDSLRMTSVDGQPRKRSTIRQTRSSLPAVAPENRSAPADVAETP